MMETFMTLVVTYDPAIRTVSGFMAFQSGPDPQRVSPGSILIQTIKHVANGVCNPLLLPCLAFGMWDDELHFEHNIVAHRLREVQSATGLLSDYLRHERLTPDDINFNTAHKTLVEQEAFLTNGIA